MAYEIPGFKHSRIASVDLSGSQYRGVALTATGQIGLPTNKGTIFGILQDKPIAGRVGAVMLTGISKAVYGGAVTAGNKLTCDATGAFIPVTAGTDIVDAEALESGATGELHTVSLMPHTV